MVYQTKTDQAHMFRLDDLMEEHAYDGRSQPLTSVRRLNLSPGISSPFEFNSANSPNVTEKPLAPPVAESIPSSIIAPNSALMASLTKLVPPPASRPCKRDLCAANQRVVFPPKSLDLSERACISQSHELHCFFQSPYHGS